MSLTLATWLARAIAFYLTLGLAFAIPFAFGWAARLDPGARGSSVGFRLLLLPGAMLLWPWLAARVMKPARSSGMNRPLRRAHLIIVVLVAAVVFPVLVAALFDQP